MVAYTKLQQRKKERVFEEEREIEKFTFYFLIFFLVGYVEERLWWPIQSPNTGGKKKASS